MATLNGNDLLHYAERLAPGEARLEYVQLTGIETLVIVLKEQREKVENLKSMPAVKAVATLDEKIRRLKIALGREHPQDNTQWEGIVFTLALNDPKRREALELSSTEERGIEIYILSNEADLFFRTTIFSRRDENKQLHSAILKYYE